MPLPKPLKQGDPPWTGFTVPFYATTVKGTHIDLSRMVTVGESLAVHSRGVGGTAGYIHHTGLVGEMKPNHGTVRFHSTKITLNAPV